MTYFRNKFDDEFLRLADNISPKGLGVVEVGDYSNLFMIYRRRPGSPYMKVLPLVLYNILESTNSADRSVENYIMLCEDFPDTKVSVLWDETYRREHKDYICDFVYNRTGDFGED